MHIFTLYKKNPFSPKFALFGYDFYLHWKKDYKFIEIAKIKSDNLSFRWIIKYCI